MKTRSSMPVTAREGLSRRKFLKGAGALAGGLFVGQGFAGRLTGTAAGAASARTLQDSNRPLLMAHYMPWYQTPAVSGYWGWHWTMNHFDPSQTDASGRPQIASHYLPLTGPYDSSDDALLEYQVLLMKLSGIDGVIVDWYGIEDFRDYAVLNASTGRLFEHIQRAGLRFCICYEDQTILHMVDEGHLDEDDALVHGQDVMRYLQDTWFDDPAYLRIGDQPALFTFGPQYFRDPANWETLFSVLDTTPALITLDGHMDWAAFSSYPWPPMWASGGIELGQGALEDYLARFYRNAQRREYVVGGAFPGFHDIYAEAGVRSSYGSLDRRDGETFRLTLDLALASDPGIVQLITWNDYGEGTIIEPTEEFGYQYLEIVQDTRRAMPLDDFRFQAGDLPLPLQLFTLRNAHAQDEAIQARLDEARDALIDGETETAAEILAGLP